MNRRRLLVALAAVSLSPAVLGQRKPRRVAVLSAGAAPDDLRDAIEALKVGVDVRSAEGGFAELEKLAAEAVRGRPDLIVAHETPAAGAAAKATQRIPIVMAQAAARIRVPVGVARVRTGDDYEAALAQWARPASRCGIACRPSRSRPIRSARGRLRTARAIEVELPDALLARADAVLQ